VKAAKTLWMVSFKRPKKGEIALSMSIINLLEVYYGFIGERGVDIAKEMMACIDDTPLKIITHISQTVYDEAARLKGTYRRISLADSIGLATAAELSGQFVTSDHHEIEKVDENEPIDIFWFR
jgi:predicted nucleic acid-binding protein